MSKRVLCLLTDGFEEIEAITPIDLLRRAGVEVVLASLTDSQRLTGRSGITIEVEILLSQCEEKAEAAIAFDMLFLPGGPGVKHLREDGRPARLAQAFVEKGKTVAAICAAPLVLHDAGLLTPHRYTAHDSTYGELTAALPEERIVVEGLLITSRGAGTALDFGLALVQALAGAPAAAQVAKSIMA